MVTLIDELYQQPQSLRSLVQSLDQGLLDQLEKMGPASGTPVLFTGMGASFHAGWIAALHLLHLGKAAFSLEAADLLYYGFPPLDDWVYISQSGESGEAPELLQKLPENVRLIALTNDPGSSLARAARLVLPIFAGEETLLASKTYLNSLAWLWLLARCWGGAWSGDELDQLLHTADRVENLLSRGRSLVDPLLDRFDPDRGLVFLGHGPHAATAREAAMTLAEWSKLPALSYSMAAFRHGFIETVRPGMGVVIFSPPGPSQPSGLDLAAELANYGARVWLVQHGVLYPFTSATPPVEPIDEFLAPLLDILPFQLYAQRIAELRSIKPGFRYIRKVVQKT
ncbi:MAG TPA: SIS domain-containing protein [Armatimonadota bacterium]|nr:SIS domain-containing protein [Armatimonadota bacterium]